MSNSNDIDAGEDQSFYTPLTHDGHVAEGTLGCFPGDAADLNIENPEPGYTYFWARLNDTDIAKAERKGWEVDTTQPARKVVVRNMRYSNIGIDGATTRGDTILMRIPEAAYRRIMQDEHEAALAARQDPSAKWTNNPEMQSLQERFSAGLRGPLTFRYPQHRMERLSKNPQ
jgi:hypothetical protein